MNPSTTVLLHTTILAVAATATLTPWLITAHDVMATYASFILALALIGWLISIVTFIVNNRPSLHTTIGVTCLIAVAATAAAFTLDYLTPMLSAVNERLSQFTSNVPIEPQAFTIIIPLGFLLAQLPKFYLGSTPKGTPG